MIEESGTRGDEHLADVVTIDAVEFHRQCPGHWEAGFRGLWVLVSLSVAAPRWSWWVKLESDTLDHGHVHGVEAALGDAARAARKQAGVRGK